MSDSDSSTTPTLSNKSFKIKKLIELVKNKKCLWDKYTPEYREKFAKTKAWRDICYQIVPKYDEMKSSVKHEVGLQVTKKWYNIRDAYRKSLRAGSRSKAYLYSDQLQFLDPVLHTDEIINSKKVKKRPTNYDDDTYDDERLSNVEDHGEPDQWLDEVFVDIDSKVPEDNVTNIPAKRVKTDNCTPKKEREIECDDSIVSVLANLIHKEEDDDRAFFKSIIPIVKQLSEESRFEFRMKVMELLHGLKKKDKEQTIMKQEHASRGSDSD